MDLIEPVVAGVGRGRRWASSYDEADDRVVLVAEELVPEDDEGDP